MVCCSSGFGRVSPTPHPPTHAQEETWRGLEVFKAFKQKLCSVGRKMEKEPLFIDHFLFTACLRPQLLVARHYINHRYANLRYAVPAVLAVSTGLLGFEWSCDLGRVQTPHLPASCTLT